tara:strand:- start:16338 stop:16982 length:645 start_codon:yes stop_codon:yes gene_type:complete
MGKHVFILSGQSNMVGLNPENSFIPTLENYFGKEQIIVVKDAKGSQAIRRWYKTLHTTVATDSTLNTYLYDQLMRKVDSAIQNKKVTTITFIWMQGERDAREKLGAIYEESLVGLYKQVSADLKRDDVNFVIGRLNDFDMFNKKWPHWTMIREIQVKVGHSNPRFAWVDTDDLNDGINKKGESISNDLHMSVEGYQLLGQRFAQKAIQLIKENK